LQPFLVVATKTTSADIPLVTLLTGYVPHANVMQVIFLSVSLCLSLCLSVSLKFDIAPPWTYS
jgi:hypothetical protein